MDEQRPAWLGSSTKIKSRAFHAFIIHFSKYWYRDIMIQKKNENEKYTELGLNRLSRSISAFCIFCRIQPRSLAQLARSKSLSSDLNENGFYFALKTSILANTDPAPSFRWLLLVLAAAGTSLTLIKSNEQNCRFSQKKTLNNPVFLSTWRNIRWKSYKRMEVDTNCLYDNDHIEFLIEFMTLPAKRQSRYLRLVQLFF